MSDDLTPFGLWYRLAKRGAAGLSCDVDGVTLGPVPLITPIRNQNKTSRQRYKLRPAGEVARAIALAYGAVADDGIEARLAGLGRVAKALDRGEDALAAIIAVHLRFPGIAADGMAKLAAAHDLRKYDPDEPRVPAGNPDGGQWTSEGEGNDSDTEDLVKLPPGQRIDELGDLLEWVANAEPEDTSAIRSEIRRLYYDVGDIQGGDALNRALSDVLDSTPNTHDREEILREFEPYTRSDPAEAAQFGRDLTTGALLFPFGTTPTPSPVGAANVWELGWVARGRQIEEALGADLPANFPVIDSFADGAAISIKSIDLNSAIYQDGGRLSTRINTYVDQLSIFDGEVWGDEVIKPADITSRILKLAIPEGSVSTAQQGAIQAAKMRAKSLGVDLMIIPF